MSRFMANSSPVTDSMLSPPISDGTATGAIRSPPGVIGSNLKSPRRRRRCRDARREDPSGPYRKFSTTVNATLAGQQENCYGLRGGRKPLLDFRVAGAGGGVWPWERRYSAHREKLPLDSFVAQVDDHSERTRTSRAATCAASSRRCAERSHEFSSGRCEAKELRIRGAL